MTATALKSEVIVPVTLVCVWSKSVWLRILKSSLSGKGGDKSRRLVTPDASLIMFKRINDAVGRSAANSLALFMVPGMGHCQGGPGTDQFDKVAALDQWIESGTKPQSILASHMTAAVVDRTRLLCAYPATAHYIGTGSTDDAKTFRCQ